MAETIIQVPGSVAANTSTSFPSYVGAVKNIKDAFIRNGASGTASPTIDTTDLTVVDTTPSAGQIQLVDEGTWECGDAIDAEDEVIFVLDCEMPVEVDDKDSYS